MLVDDAAAAGLATSRFGRLVQLGETASTNAVAWAAAGEPEGLVVVADYQSAGRGRFDRRWESPPGTSLLFSVLMRPGAEELPPGRRHLAVAALSLAIVDAAAAVAGVDLELKWPNDVVHGDAKVAGILAEATGGDLVGGAGLALVVGAGVNVAWAPDGLGATSLQALARREVGRAALLVAALGALDGLYGHWGEVARRYRSACATVGRTVLVLRGGGMADLEGVAVGVDDGGHLLVEVAGGRVEAVAAGDVLHASPSPPPNL
jgi:BirA family biotin operon repressor/biotin-[acetyl-CoA-carboxylase] ligase